MKPKTDNSQSEHFIETAPALGCDEDEATFKAKLGRIARQKPDATVAKAMRKPPGNRSG
jgi:hypothetical protein